jgi:hypothetical protein
MPNYRLSVDKFDIQQKQANERPTWFCVFNHGPNKLYLTAKGINFARLEPKAWLVIPIAFTGSVQCQIVGRRKTKRVQFETFEGEGLDAFCFIAERAHKAGTSEQDFPQHMLDCIIGNLPERKATHERSETE